MATDRTTPSPPGDLLINGRPQLLRRICAGRAPRRQSREREARAAAPSLPPLISHGFRVPAQSVTTIPEETNDFPALHLPARAAYCERINDSVDRGIAGLHD